MNPIRNRARRGLWALVAVPMLALAPACTDLTEVPADALTPDNAFRTQTEILAGVASVYAGLRPTMWGYYNLSEITTDEMIVPTRGSDWFDNGRWLEIHKQTWSPNSGSALDDMNGTWNDLNSGVARSNLMISVLRGQDSTAARDSALAELRTLRAWYYHGLMDMFGNVPLVTEPVLEARAQVSRDSMFKFLEAELLDSRKFLPLKWPAAQHGRITKGAANAMLASMYLNAQVFTGTVTANGLERGAARWQDAIDAADSVINSGVYSLATDWKGNFSITNDNSPENIFVIKYTAVAGLGMSLPMRTLHYNQLSTGNGGPWNGFATLAETYRAFDENDKRREIFLVGQQVSFQDGLPVTDRAGNPLIFTDTIGNERAASEAEGARFNKFPPMPSAPNGDGHPNDFPIFRLAEMHLIKAEALNELGQVGPAMVEVNRVRARQFDNPVPLVAASQADARDIILNERLFEFAGEAKRRRDLIRAGRFTEARHFKDAQPEYKILFPIPQTQIGSNPLLVQNPGY